MINSSHQSHTQSKHHSVLKVALMNGHSQKSLFKKLRESGVLFTHGTVRNLPKPQYVRAGYFTTATTTFFIGDFCHQHEQTRITQSGLGFIKQLLKGEAVTLAAPAFNKQLGQQTLTHLRQQLAAN